MSSPRREEGETPAPTNAGDADMKPAAASPPPSQPDAGSDTKKRKELDGGDAEMKDESKGDSKDETKQEEKEEGEAEEKPKPEKRRRIDDGKRSARMFGNILGTLRKFQDDEGKTKKSEAVSRNQSECSGPLHFELLWCSQLP